MNRSPKRNEENTPTTRQRPQHKDRAKKKSPSVLAPFSMLVADSVSGPLSRGYQDEVNK